MTNKLVVIINSFKVPKMKTILLYEIKFLVPNYSCLQSPWLGGYRPQIPVLSLLCPELNLLNPPPEQNSWVRHSKKVFLDVSSRMSFNIRLIFASLFLKIISVNLVSLAWNRLLSPWPEIDHNCTKHAIYHRLCSASVTAHFWISQR